MKKILFLHISELIDSEKPDLLIGNSCGAFYAQMIAPIKSIPALPGNPHFRMSEFLNQRIGQHEYKSPRKDGNQSFVIDDALVKEFAALEATQFDNVTVLVLLDVYRRRYIVRAVLSPRWARLLHHIGVQPFKNALIFSQIYCFLLRFGVSHLPQIHTSFCVHLLHFPPFQLQK